MQTLFHVNRQMDYHRNVMHQGAKALMQAPYKRENIRGKGYICYPSKASFCPAAVER